MTFITIFKAQLMDKMHLQDWLMKWRKKDNEHYDQSHLTNCHPVYSDMWTQPHWASFTYISRPSPAWKFHLHFTRTADASSALTMFHPPEKKHGKNNKALFEKKKAPGENPFVSTKLWAFKGEPHYNYIFFYFALICLE